MCHAIWIYDLEYHFSFLPRDPTPSPKEASLLSPFEEDLGEWAIACMAGYSSLCELFFIMSKFDFDRVDPLEPNFLVLDNIDIE